MLSGQQRQGFFILFFTLKTRLIYYIMTEMLKGDSAMLVSTKGRYALRVMIDLAEHPTDGYIPLKEIAKRQDISEKYLEAILKVLVRENIITGLRGKGGGYKLTRRPEEYTVGEILRLSEDDLSPVSCLEGSSTDCPLRAKCSTYPVWEGLAKVVNDYLDGITVAELMESPCEE